MFDFDYYKKIVDFINSSTNDINIKIDDLEELAIQIREGATINVPVNTSTTEEIKVGDYLQIIPKTNSWKFLGNVNIRVSYPNNLECDYSEVTDNTIVLKKDLDKYKKNISNLLVKRDNPVLIARYTPDVDLSSLTGSSIPNVRWLRDNYVLKTTPTIGFPLYVLNESSITDNTVLNIQDILNNANINKFLKTISIDVQNNLKTNYFTASVVSFVKNPEFTGQVKIDKNFNTDTLSKDQSVMTYKAIELNMIRKDLGNMKAGYIEVGENINEYDIVDTTYLWNNVKNFGVTNLLLKGNIEQKYLENIKLAQTPVELLLDTIENTSTYEEFSDKVRNYFTTYKGKLSFNDAKKVLIASFTNYYFDLSISSNYIKHYYRTVPASLTTSRIMIALVSSLNSNILVDESTYKAIYANIESQLMENNENVFDAPKVFANSNELFTMKDLQGLLDEWAHSVF